MTHIPVFALGGVKQPTVVEAMSAGAHGIALISAIISSPNPMLATEELLRTISGHAVKYTHS
jgi:thiamine-phosphate pyrophosphorylase